MNSTDSATPAAANRTRLAVIAAAVGVVVVGFLFAIASRNTDPPPPGGPSQIETGATTDLPGVGPITVDTADIPGG
jgi:hypothetical protein